MTKPILKTFVPTYFASPARASDAELHRSIRLATASPIVTTLLDAVGGAVLVLNAERQIVAANAGALEVLGLSHERLGEALGLRPGEALGCVQVPTTPSGCGTGVTCASCGAARAIVNAQSSGLSVEEECILRVVKNDVETSQEYRVRAAPVLLEQSPFVLFVLHDIADKKRREHLERAFFHDLTNTLGALKTFGSLATESSGVPEPSVLHKVSLLIDRVVEEVRSHRDLLRAELGEMALHVEPCSTREIMASLQLTFDQLDLCAGRQLELQVQPAEFETDRALLLRTLTNMVKNALEATAVGGTVQAFCRVNNESVEFLVRNPGRIPEDIAARIFTRSFSTKAGSGRGIGTYSMKLLGERYLGGQVRHVTRDDSTEFTLKLPRSIPSDAQSLTRLRVH